MLSCKEDAIVFTYHGETVQIEVWGENAIRVRAWMDACMPQAHSALLEKPASACRVERRAHAAVLHSGKLRARVSEEGLLGFYNENGLMLEEFGCFRVPPDEDYPTRIQNLPLRLSARQWYGTPQGWGVSVRFTAPEEEQLFGMGQYQQETWNLKGATLELMQRNTQCSVPFVLSSAGYGFLWNNPAVGRATFGTNDTLWQAQSTRMIDYWITAGDTPQAIIKQYAQATGYAPDMPEYALGFWQCKLRYRTQEEVLQVARAYRRMGIPLSAIIIDFFHWTRLGEWRFDAQCFPDPSDMVRQLHDMGIRVGVSVWPHVAWDSEYHHDLYARGLLMRADMGCDLTDTYGGNSTYLDLTNPQAQAFITEKITENYESCGVDFYWLDEAEPELPFYDQGVYRYHVGSAMEAGNLFPLYYAQAFARMEKQRGKPVMNLIRCAWAGSQRYGALVWSGDIPSTFRAMRIQLTAALHMGVAGIPWWTMDIGGFRGGNIHDPLFRELLARWFAFGAFCPVMRLHGHREPVTEEEQQKGYLQTGADNEIWSFGEAALQVCKTYIRIRSYLKPYLRQVFAQAHTEGLPVMRALFMQYPLDKSAWAISDEYLLGSDLLIAPVFTPGADERKAYLPRGDHWINAWTGQRDEGGQFVTAPAPLHVIPVWIREAQFPALRELLCVDAWAQEKTEGAC